MAHYQDDERAEQQLRRAELYAKQNLVSGIRVTVESSAQSSAIVERDNHHDELISKTENKIEARSKLDLPGLGIDRKWQNPETCTIYVQVRLSESVVELVLKYLQAQEFLADARNVENTVRFRMHAIGEAVRIASLHEFGDIPGHLSSEQMLRELYEVKSEIALLNLRTNHAVVIVNESEFLDDAALTSISQRFQEALPGSFELSERCRSSDSCMKKANDVGANYASTVFLKMVINRQNGFWIGDFSISLTLWNVSEGSVIYSSGNRKNRVMNRHKHKLTLSSAFRKWEVQHSDVIDAHRKEADRL